MIWRGQSATPWQCILRTWFNTRRTCMSERTVRRGGVWSVLFGTLAGRSIVLSVVLLFYNFSAYMVRREFRELAIRVDAVAKLAAAEIERGGGRDVGGMLQKREAEAAREFPDVSMAVVHVDRPCNGRTSSAD